MKQELPFFGIFTNLCAVRQVPLSVCSNKGVHPCNSKMIPWLSITYKDCPVEKRAQRRPQICQFIRSVLWLHWDKCTIVFDVLHICAYLLTQALDSSLSSDVWDGPPIGEGHRGYVCSGQGWKGLPLPADWHSIPVSEHKLHTVHIQCC